MERESFEDAEAAALMNEHFVCVKVDREERPDVDALYMEARAGDDRPGRLAAERVPHARAGAVLRRHLLPARAAPRPARRGARCCSPSPRRGTSAATRSSPTRDGMARAPARRRAAAPGDRADRRRSCSTRRSTTLRATYDSVNGGWGGAPKFPASSVIEFLLARGERAMSIQTLRSMASRRHPRPGRRRLRPLQRRRALDRARTSRRCSTTTRCSRAPTCTAGSSPATRCCAAPARRCSTGRCARCAPRTAASSARSTPTARASRASSTSGRVGELVDALGAGLRRGAGLARRDRRGQLPRGRARRERARVARRRARRRDTRADPRALLEVRARRVWPATDDKRLDELERAARERARRRRRGAAARGLPRRRARDRGLPAHEMRDEDGRLLRTFNQGRASSARSSRTTRSCSRR